MKVPGKRIYLFLWMLLCLLMAAETVTGEDVAVIVNQQNAVRSLTPREISDMFLGRRRAFPSGEPLLVLEQDRDCALRENFFLLLNGMTLKRLNAYWARLQFSGEVQPPPVLPDSNAMLKAVGSNPTAIGYVESTVVDDSVRVILLLKE